MQAATEPSEASHAGSEPSDAELVELYRASATDVAFSELVRRHQIGIFRLLLSLLGDADTAEKLCEETFVQAARKLDTLADTGAFQPWLASIARGLVAKQEAARPARTRRKPPAGPPPVDPRGRVKHQVRGVLSELSNEERAALVLAELEGDSMETIAATLGTSVADASALVERARTHFVDELVRRADADGEAEESANDDTLPAGRVLGRRFRVDARLGAGGMGAVYRALDLDTGRAVALKTLLPSAAKDPALRKRFEREAKILRSLDHPNFVRFVDYGAQSSEPAYVVMELADGRALSQLLELESKLAPARALHIVRHVLTGLEHAHARGIVHRDVKPDNVVLVSEPADPEFAKILDFGIARLSDAEAGDKTKLTGKGEIFGTPLYMAPEQVRGDAADARADLYSVSVMLYEMLAARPPFVCKSQNGLFAMHLASAPPPLVEHVPELERVGELQALLDHGLAKDPAERFGSAKDYRERLEQLVVDNHWAYTAGDIVARAAPVASPAATSPARRRSRAHFLLIGALALLAALLALLVWRLA